MLIQSASEYLKGANRRVLVVGAPGTGKTTFSVSASKHAGDRIPANPKVQCSDVVVFSGDNEGIQGAVDAGLVPAAVVALESVGSWVLYQKVVREALDQLRPKFESGELTNIVVDLELPGRLIDEAISPEVQKDWKLVANEGTKLFKLFSGLSGVTVIGNAQLKAASSPGETNQAIDAANAKSVGGERALYTTDLHKGVKQLWINNNSLMVAREAKRERVGKDTKITYYSHTESSHKFEAKSRFRSVIAAVEPGEVTLRNMLARMEAYNA